MAYKDDVNALLKELGENLGCSLKLDDSDTAMMGLDEDNLGVVFYAEDGEDAANGAVIVNIVIGTPPADNADLLYSLLNANYLWNSTGGGMLAIDENSGSLTLQRFVDLPVSYPVFENIFTQLVGAARYWRERLEEEVTEQTLPDQGLLRV